MLRTPGTHVFRWLTSTTRGALHQGCAKPRGFVKPAEREGKALLKQCTLSKAIPARKFRMDRNKIGEKNPADTFKGRDFLTA